MNPEELNLNKTPNNIQELQKWTSARLAGRQQRILRFNTLLRLLNISINPTKIIKLAGTNGKGSVGAMLESIAIADHKKVGLYTSPHLNRITERLRFNKEEISQTSLDQAVRKIAPTLQALVNQHGLHLLPSFFEVLTLIALDYFQCCGADIMILEAGIGGYNDILHLIPGDIAVITSVALDHTDELGTTLSAIGADKAGIASPNSTLVLGLDIPKSALMAILDDARGRGVTIVHSHPEIFQVESLGFQGSQITIPQEKLTFVLPLLGSFQIENLGTAKAVVDLLIWKGKINNQTSLAGVSQVSCLGRMEVIPGNPTWLLDVAHNAHGIHKVARNLSQLTEGKKLAILLGLSDHNKVTEIVTYIRVLREVFSCSIYLTDGFYKAQNPADYLPALQDVTKLQTLGEYEATLKFLLQTYEHQEDAVILVTGSLFLVGVCRDYLLNQ